MKFLGEMYLMMISKVTQKQSFTLSSDGIFFEIYIFRVNVWIFFLNETSILVFAELAIFHSINKLKKNC